MEIEMKVRGLMLDPTANTPIVILKDINSDVILPIWVGPFEANAIAFEVEKISPSRPMTHDLLRNFIIQIGGELKRIIITNLKENTFYATIELCVEDKIILLDSRPSDAIALALRMDSKIFVDELIIQNSSGILIEKDLLEETLRITGEDEFDWPDEIDEID